LAKAHKTTEEERENHQRLIHEGKKTVKSGNDKRYGARHASYSNELIPPQSQRENVMNGGGAEPIRNRDPKKKKKRQRQSEKGRGAGGESVPRILKKEKEGKAEFPNLSLRKSPSGGRSDSVMLIRPKVSVCENVTGKCILWYSTRGGSRRLVRGNGFHKGMEKKRWKLIQDEGSNSESIAENKGT